MMKNRQNRNVTLAWFILAVGVSAPGCKGPESAQWFINGFIDPTQVGQFLEPRRNEIRQTLSILEEPPGIQTAGEPEPEDLVPNLGGTSLAPGDTFTVSIFELLVPGQATTLQIRLGSSGVETLPVIGPVRMAGLTPREVEMSIREILREREILPEADVQVTVIQSRSEQFTVVGSVSQPGVFPVLGPDFRLLEAIALFGGVPPQLDTIYVFRRGAARSELWRGVDPTQFIDMAGPGVNGDGTTAPVQPALLMSDFGSNTTSGPTTTRSATQPGARVIQPQTTQGTPDIRWDPEKGWVIDEGPSTAVAVPEAPATEPTTAPADPWEAFSDLTEPVRIIEIPMGELLEGDPRYNIIIRPMDLVNVPPGNVGEYFMMGNIARPGAYQLTGRRITVKEAIASAGGFGPLAWPSRADLIRRVTREEEIVIQLDLDAIFAGNAPDFYMRPSDTLNVGSHALAGPLAVLRNAFRFTYGFGFVYDRNFADSDTFQAQEQLKARRRQEALQRGLPF